MKRVLWVGLLAVLLAGCRSVRLPPVNTLDGGWTVRQGQALWRPSNDAPEIAGEILLATDRSGQAFLQFTKNPLPFVTVQTSNHLWAIEFVPQKKRYSGRGTPNPRLMWVHLARGLSGGSVSLPLTLQHADDGAWTLQNHKTGERIAGFINP